MSDTPHAGALAAYIIDRDALLLNPSLAGYLALCERWNLPKPTRVLSAWGAIHKARLHVEAISEGEKSISRDWLRRHNMREDIW